MTPSISVEPEDKPTRGKGNALLPRGCGGMFTPDPRNPVRFPCGFVTPTGATLLCAPCAGRS